MGTVRAIVLFGKLVKKCLWRWAKTWPRRGQDVDQHNYIRQEIDAGLENAIHPEHSEELSLPHEKWQTFRVIVIYVTVTGTWTWTWTCPEEVCKNHQQVKATKHKICNSFSDEKVLKYCWNITGQLGSYAMLFVHCTWPRRVRYRCSI